MALREGVFLMLCILCSSRDVLAEKLQPCGLGQKDCVPEGADIPSGWTLKDVLFLCLPSPTFTLLISVIVFTLYMTHTLPGSLCLPWRLRSPQPRRYAVQQTEREPFDLATLSARLSELECERNELRAQLDKKRLREKPSELDLARQWVNPPQIRAEQTRLWTVSTAVTPSKHRGSTGSLDMRRRKDDDSNEESKLDINVWKVPSLPTRFHASTMTCIPMPTNTTAQRSVIDVADYARKSREALEELADAEKRIILLTKETEVMRSVRDELDVVVDQKNMLGRRVAALNRENKQMQKQITTLQEEAKTERQRFVDVKKQHQALIKQFDRMSNNAKALARDKRLVDKQLLEAREELDMVREKLDGIHREKSQLIETLEHLTTQGRLDDAKSSNVQKEQSINVSRRKSSSTQKMPFRNQFSFGKQRNMASEQITERRKSAYAVVNVSSRNKSSQRGVHVTTPRSTTGAVPKAAKTLEDKSEDLVHHRQSTKEKKFERMSSRSLSTPPLRVENKDQVIKEQLKTKKVNETSKKEYDYDNEKKKNVAKVIVKKTTNKIVKSPREMGTKSSVDVTEFAKSLQRLERNVEINMRVRETTAFHVKDRKPEDENMALTEIYHNTREETDNWESSTVTQEHTRSDVSTSDKSKPVDSQETIETLESDSELGVNLDRCCGDEEGSKTDLDTSSYSLCCLDSRCSMCSRADCPLEHRCCSDLNCMAVCLSCCSLPLERSQSIVSTEESLNNADVGTRAAATPSFFGNGSIGASSSGIAGRSIRIVPSFLECHDSLGEVAAVGVDSSSNEQVPRRPPAPVKAESSSEGAAKKLISRFTAANRSEERLRRAGPPSPTLIKFLEELTSLATNDKSIKSDDTESEEEQMTKELNPYLIQNLINAANSPPSELCTYGNVDTDSDASSARTEYYINDEKEPLF